MAGAEANGAIARLTEELSKLPGIGPKTAERLTHFLLAADRREVLALADALRGIKDNVHRCRQCFNLTEGDLCHLCADPRRDPTLICVVEQPRDVTALERAGTYHGLYHVLHGRLAPLDNVGPEDLTVEQLLRRVQAGTGVRITRLARGLPSGSVLEFANNQMLADALEGRRSF